LITLESNSSKKKKKKQQTKKKPKNELRGLSNYRLLAKLVPTFADRRCHVVSVTGPYGHNLDFLLAATLSYR
jgi:hypothetical protein